MGKKGKTGKNRQDKFYHLAKEQGFRSRASFKLVQLNKRHDFLSSAARGVIDLCAAPGGWMQVARKHMPLEAPCLGIDLVPIRPVGGCVGLVGDITADTTRSDLKRALKQHQGASSDEKVDVVLNDGSPNMGKAWLQDAYTQSELTLAALRLASEFLAPGGTFVTKVFRSNDYNSLLFVMNQLFKRVNATKPSASRAESAEIYVMCMNYRAPKSIDPRLLNPKFVFKDMTASDPTARGDNEEDRRPDLFLNTVMKDMKKQKRHRGGYEDGALTLFHRVPIIQYCRTTRPVALMVESSQFSFDLKVNTSDDVPEESATKILEVLRNLPRTSNEVLSCCEDLKVLARSDFKLLLKWRLAARKELESLNLLNPASAEDSDAPEKSGESGAGDVEMKSAGEGDSSDGPDEDEEDFDEELKKARAEITAKDKRKKRKENKLRSALQRKIDMKIILPEESGMAETNVPEGLFSIKTALRAKRHGIAVAEVPVDDPHEADDERDDDMEGEQITRLPYKVGVINNAADENTVEVEDELDRWYKVYLTEKKKDKFGNRLVETKERRRITKRRALREAVEKEKEEQDGGETQETGSKLVIDSSDSSDPEEGVENFLNENTSAKSREAALWFSQPLFQNMAGLSSDEPSEMGSDDEHSDDDEEQLVGEEDFRSAARREARKATEEKAKKLAEEGEDGFEVVPVKKASSGEEDSGDESSGSSFHSSDYDTDEKAEMVAIGRRMRQSKTEASDVLDEAYNRYTFDDPMDLPRWFADTDPLYRARRPPVTKEQVAEVKEYIKSLQAAPTKKEAEAKARRKARVAKKVEAMKVKANSIAEQGDVPVSSRMRAIEDLYKQALKSGKGGGKKNKRKQYQVIRPNGRLSVGKNPARGRKAMKGARSTLVDRRLKSDKRGIQKAKERNAKASKR